MTYLWQEEKGKNFYKVQTDEAEIAHRIKRRNGFRLSAIGMNCKLWIFNCEFTRPDRARRVIKSITDKKWRIDSEGVIIYE